MIAALLAALALLVAQAAPTVIVDATVDRRLAVIEGTLTLPEGWLGEPVDPQAALPEPPDDLNLLRTYPGARSRGAVTWTRDGDLLRFRAELPRRFGAVGRGARGLFVNGAWYPQPVEPGGLPILDWDVTVHLPDGVTGVVGDAVDQGTVRWRGTGERAPLAVVRRGQLTEVADDVRLLTAGRPRRVLARELTDGLRRARLDDVPQSGVIVEAPLRRRLTRAGPGLSYVSDRAFRLTPGLQRYHRVAVIRGVSEGLLDQPDPFARSVAAAGISRHHAAQLKGAGAAGLLQRFAWVPTVNWLLASRRMPFYAEILERTHPHDPVADDLVEVFAPYTPGTVVLAQLDDTYGEGTGQRIGLDLARGASLPDVARDGGPDLGWLEQWRAPYPVQDYTLAVDRDAGRITVARDAEPGAQRETLVVRVDGEREGIVVPPGGSVTWNHPDPGRVALDPDGHVAQTSRLGDTWPPRYTSTVAGWIDTVNLTRLQLYGSGQLTLRRQHDTRNLWFGTLSTSPGSYVAGRVAWLRKAGRLQDGFNRPHRVTLGAGAAVLDPAFARVDRVRPSLTASVAYAWDTRVGHDFPLRGRRLGATVGGGFIPGLGERWSSAQATAAGVGALHPRHVVAARTSLAVAESNVPWRLLGLGGAGSMVSLPVLPPCGTTDEGPCAEQARLRWSSAAEYRVAPLRNASVPMLLAWGQELQLTGGVEGVLAEVNGAPAAAIGATAGLAGVADILGAEPMMMGVTAGWPIWWTGLPQVQRRAVPELYLRWSQAF